MIRKILCLMGKHVYAKYEVYYDRSDVYRKVCVFCGHKTKLLKLSLTPLPPPKQ